MGWQEGEEGKGLLRLFSEMIFSESFIQTVIFAVGASRVTIWRAEGSTVAPSGIAPGASAELQDL